jgi:transcription initiation factor IIF auxiliary subunit
LKRTTANVVAPSLQVLRLKTPGISRMDNVSISRPIVYGSIAFWMGKNAPETKSFRWSIYIRGLQCEDLSYMISKGMYVS